MKNNKLSIYLVNNEECISVWTSLPDCMQITNKQKMKFMLKKNWFAISIPSYCFIPSINNRFIFRDLVFSIVRQLIKAYSPKTILPWNDSRIALNLMRLPTKTQAMFVLHKNNLKKKKAVNPFSSVMDKKKADIIILVILLVWDRSNILKTKL